MKLWIGKHFIKCTRNIKHDLYEFGGGSDWKLVVAVMVMVAIVVMMVVMDDVVVLLLVMVMAVAVV